MSYQALARKWRPRDFDAIVGQEHVVRALVNAFERDRLHHAYLFSGTRGVGKTTIARVFAKGLNCERGPTARPCGGCAVCREIDEGRHVDLIEVDAASRARVEETRDLLDNVLYAPVRARSKVYLIDEVHMFSRHSFNALLKTLEEPPPHVKFLLATTDPQRLPVTIVSRCLQFGLRRLSVEEIAAELARIAEAEEIEAEPEALRALARAADGSMRDALSLLDQAAAYGAGRVVAGDVRGLLGTAGGEELFALLEALAAADAPAMIEALDRIAGEAADFEVVLGEVIESLGRMAALQVVSAGREEDREVEALRALASRISPQALQLYYQIGLIGRRDLPYAPHPRGALEMTMLRMAAFAPMPDTAVSASPEGGPGPSGSPGAPPEVRGEPEHRRTGAAASGYSTSGPPATPPGPAVREVEIGEKPAPAQVVPSPEGEAPPGRDPPPPLHGAVPPSGHEGPRSPEPPAPRLDGDPPPPSRAGEAPPSTLLPSDWPEVCRRLSLNGVAGQLASNCIVRRHAGDLVELTLGVGHAQLLNSGTRDALEAALRVHLGRPVRLRVTVGDRRNESESPAERLAREERERIERTAADLRAVPDYQDLLARFEGSTRSIHPPD